MNDRQQFSRYVSRSVLGMVGLSCYILADTFFISLGLGPDGLTALNLAIPVYSFIAGCGILCGMGGSTLFAIAGGAGRREEAGRAFSHALVLAGIFSLVMIPAGLFLSEELTVLLGADGVTFADTHIYLKTLLLFAPAFLFNQTVLFFVRADGAPGTAMAAMLTGSFGNILLDWIFIFPLRMGMFGAVFATCLAPVMSLAVLGSHFFRKRNSFRPGRIRELRPLVRICGLGSGGLVSELASGIVIILFNLIFLRLGGNTAVAAYGITANLALVASAVFSGIAQGIQPLLGHQYGAGDERSVRQTLRLGLVTAVVLAAVIWIGVLVFSLPLAGIFNQEGSAGLTGQAAYGLRLYFSGFLFAGCSMVLSVLFSSTDRPGRALTVSLLRGGAVTVPAALIASLLGETAVWLAVPAAELITLVIALLLLKKR